MLAQKGNILVPVLTIVALLALASTAYLFWQNQQLQYQSPQSPTKSTISDTTPSPSPTTHDETTNWKAYTGDLKQLSFKYPPELNLSVDYQNSIWLTEFDSSGLSEGDIGLKPHFLTIDKAPKNNFRQECSPIIIKTETAHLANGSAVKLEIGKQESNALCGPKPGTEIEINGVINQKGNTWLLKSELMTGDLESRLETINQILSTFKFTN